MISSDKKMVQAFVASCYEAGMSKVICSPGSRNASLVIAFDEHPAFECILIHDERSAAFVGMGMAQELQQPVGIVCTSGSAMLNYYPAVAEAYYQRIPLVVISADRPEKWINQGDGQTIVQKGVYTNHIETEVHLTEEMAYTHVQQSTMNAFEKIAGHTKGPIHFNIALEEPLYQTTEISDKLPPLKKWEIPQNSLTSDELNIIKEGLKFDKKLILIGQMVKKPYLEELLKNLANDPSIAILVENTSNLVSMKWIHCIDRTLQGIKEEELADFAPDVLITLGGAVVSKRIKAFLRTYKPKMHWKVGYDFPEMNTFESLTHSFQVSETTFIQSMLDSQPEVITSNYGSKWKQRDFVAQDKATNHLYNVPFSDLKAIELMLDCIPEHSHIHMGNSSIVRYCQLFDPIASMTYFSNRGTSGIDGCTSTAIGSALAKPDIMHVLLTGDVSFFYDSNALWNNYNIPNLRIILVNNGGGGIFNIIKGPRNSKQNSGYFEAKHSFNASHLAQTYGVDYFEAKSENELLDQMHDFYTYNADGGIKLIEIHTESIENHLILDHYFAALSN